MNMLSTSDENEKIICLDHIGTYQNPRGLIKVLVATIRVEKPQRKEVRY
jgi:hypothetical protein